MFLSYSPVARNVRHFHWETAMCKSAAIAWYTLRDHIMANLAPCFQRELEDFAILHVVSYCIPRLVFPFL